jgi:hypothetical protein
LHDYWPPEIKYPYYGIPYAVNQYKYEGLQQI